MLDWIYLAHLPWVSDLLAIFKGTNAKEPRSATYPVSPELVPLAMRDQASEVPSLGYGMSPSSELCVHFQNLTRDRVVALYWFFFLCFYHVSTAT